MCVLFVAALVQVTLVLRFSVYVTAKMGFVTLQVLPSPTTGKFSFAPSGDYRESGLMIGDSDKGKENNFEDTNASSFAFKPMTDSASFPYLNATNKVIGRLLFFISLFYTCVFVFAPLQRLYMSICYCVVYL